MKINQMNYERLIKNEYDKGEHYFICLYERNTDLGNLHLFIECYGTLEKTIEYCEKSFYQASVHNIRIIPYDM